mgnify:CR=1 FL=1
MSIIRKTVYLSRDNTFVITFTSVDEAGTSTAVDLSGIYSLRFALVGSAVDQADYTTLSSGSVLDTSLGDGQVRFKLGGITGLTAGAYTMRLAYLTTAGDTAPSQLAHEDGPDVIRVRVVDSAYV